MNSTQTVFFLGVAFSPCKLISLIFKIELFFAASAQISSAERAVVTFHIYFFATFFVAIRIFWCEESAVLLKHKKPEES